MKTHNMLFFVFSLMIFVFGGYVQAQHLQEYNNYNLEFGTIYQTDTAKLIQIKPKILEVLSGIQIRINESVDSQIDRMQRRYDLVKDAVVPRQIERLQVIKQKSSNDKIVIYYTPAYNYNNSTWLQKIKEFFVQDEQALQYREQLKLQDPNYQAALKIGKVLISVINNSLALSKKLNIENLVLVHNPSPNEKYLSIIFGSRVIP